MQKIAEERLISIDSALEMTQAETEEGHRSYINSHFVTLLKLLGLNKKFIKAKGNKLWDENHRVYLDFLGAYGALNLGHNHDGIIESLKQVMELPNLLQTSINAIPVALAKNLALIAPGDLKHTFFCNSGAEAVEGAIKLAKIATGKARIIYCKGSFHGKSMGALSVTGRDKYKKFFNPLMPMTEQVIYGDLSSLQQVVDRYDDIAAFIIEPIQGEGGVILPPKGYLKEAADILKTKGILLIIDEVQTGLGRTGYWFACQQELIEPDILCIAKSLGGGIMPIGAYMATEKVWKKGYGSLDKCLLHTSTFGGNTWACAAGIATLEIIQEENLINQAAEKGEYFLEKLKKLQKEHGLIKEVRGRGLMIGIEFKELGSSFMRKYMPGEDLLTEYTGGMIASELLNQYQIVTAYTLNNPQVIRVEPPLIVSYEEIDYFINSLKSILQKRLSLTGMTLQSGKNLFNSLTKGVK
ncbi:aspartate aminotransferase family protein [Alkaliphilus crotonatoxidans]